MTKSYNFCLAEHNIRLTFCQAESNDITLVPSLLPFRVKDSNDDCILQIFIDNNTADDEPVALEHIGLFPTGNSNVDVYQTKSGGYIFNIMDLAGKNVCDVNTQAGFTHTKVKLYGTDSERAFGLNNAIMMVYAFCTSYKQTLLIHASVVRNNGYGYAFTAPSGTGKSTHTSLWIKHIPGSDLMNDDNPIVRIIGNRPYIYGSPWSGKTPCYRNIKAPLGAIGRICRAPKNSVVPMKPMQAFAKVLPACSTMRWDKEVFGNTCDTLSNLIEATPHFYTINCLPDKDAAETCYNAIGIKQYV